MGREESNNNSKRGKGKNRKISDDGKVEDAAREIGGQGRYNIVLYRRVGGFGA